MAGNVVKRSFILFDLQATFHTKYLSCILGRLFCFALYSFGCHSFGFRMTVAVRAHVIILGTFAFRSLQNQRKMATFFVSYRTGTMMANFEIFIPN